MPLIAAVCMPLTAGTAPTRMTWAPPAGPDPVGASVVSASAVAAGSVVLPESSTGAWMGRRHQHRRRDRGLPVVGGGERDRGGMGARRRPTGTRPRATPAASATGSAPGTRVVFLVAMVGEAELLRRLRRAWRRPRRWRSRWTVAGGACSSLGSPPPHAARTRARSPAIAGIAPLRAPRDTRACMRAGTLPTASSASARVAPSAPAQRGGRDGHCLLAGQVGILPLA